MRHIQSEVHSLLLQRSIILQRRKAGRISLPIPGVYVLHRLDQAGSDIQPYTRATNKHRPTTGKIGMMMSIHRYAPQFADGVLHKVLSTTCIYAVRQTLTDFPSLRKYFRKYSMLNVLHSTCRSLKYYPCVIGGMTKTPSPKEKVAEKLPQKEAPKSTTENAKPAETKTTEIVTYDTMNNSQRMELLQKVINEPPVIDRAVLEQELKANGITYTPSADLLGVTVVARKEFANGLLAGMRVSQAVMNVYNQCVKENWEPKQARKYAEMMVLGKDLKGAITSRQLRNLFPAEAKMESRAREQPTGTESPHHKVITQSVEIKMQLGLEIGRLAAAGKVSVLHLIDGEPVKVDEKKPAVMTPEEVKKNDGAKGGKK